MLVISCLIQLHNTHSWMKMRWVYSVFVCLDLCVTVCPRFRSLMDVTRWVTAVTVVVSLVTIIVCAWLCLLHWSLFVTRGMRQFRDHCCVYPHKWEYLFMQRRNLPGDTWLFHVCIKLVMYGISELDVTYSQSFDSSSLNLHFYDFNFSFDF